LSKEKLLLPAYKVTRYCITQVDGYLFDSWQLQASNDNESWIVLHAGTERFIGKRYFDIPNDSYYENYRINILRWLPDQQRGLANLELFSKPEDISSTTTTYTTTTTTTTTTTLSTTTLSTTTTTTSTTTTATTESVWCAAPLNLTVIGTASLVSVHWDASLFATAYELEVQENGSFEWSPVTNLSTLSYVYRGFANTTKSLQFRIRALRSGFASPWIFSNVFTIPTPQARFIARFGGEETDQFLSVPSYPAIVEFIDLSEPSSPESEIVSWEWRFFAHYLAQEPYSTSSIQHPVRSYSSPGLFAVSLTVTENSGRSHTVVKESFLEVACALIAEFSGCVSGSPPELEMVNASLDDTIQFADTSSGSSIVGWKWKFYQNDQGQVTSDYVQSSLKDPVFHYSKAGIYSVELEVTGAFGQTSKVLKEYFVQISQYESTTTTTTTTTSTTTTTTTTLSTVSTTSQPPEGWVRIGVFGGRAIASSQRFGYESWRAFDKNLSSEWRADMSSTTTTTSTTTSSTSTQLPSYQSQEISDLWFPNNDIKDFRDNFLDIFIGQSRYKLTKYQGLPSPYNPSLHRGMFVYDEVTDDFYVGLSTSWQRVNPAQLLHVLSHTSGGNDEFLVVSPYAPYSPFVGQIWIDTSDTETTTTTTASQSSTTHWSGNIAVPGPWGSGECSSEITGHECSKAFDVSTNTYWQSANETSLSTPEWAGFWWEERKVIKVYRMTVNSDGTIPITWELKASRDGLVWTTIDYRANQTFSGMRTYTLTNFTDFNYYRFFFYETLDGLPPAVVSLEMFEGLPKTTTTTTTLSTTTVTTATTQDFGSLWFQKSVEDIWFLAPVTIGDPVMQFTGSISIGDMTHSEFDTIEGAEGTTIHLDSSLTLIGNMVNGDFFIFGTDADLFGSGLQLLDFTSE
jgi:PKD repeat protein